MKNGMFQQSCRPLQLARTGVLLIGMASTLFAQTISFIDHKDFPAGAIQPAVFAQGDLNGDGHPDLVVPDENANADSVDVLLGNPNGTFAAPIPVPVGVGESSAVVIAGFNGDKKMGIAVTGALSNSVGILLGKGDGTFGSPQVFTVGNFPVAIVAADFNGDTITDLAVTNQLSNNVSVLLGTGTGTFHTATNFSVGQAPEGLAAGDFNGDGHPDLAVAADAGNAVSILIGNPNGTFRQPAISVTVPRPTCVAIDDLNHDGKQDLIVTSAQTHLDQVFVLLGNGNATFQPAKTFALASVASPVYVATDDFNNDSNRDVIVANEGTNTVSVLLGDGKGNLGTARNFTVAREPIAVITGDYNGDGKRDFITSNAGGTSVSVGLGKGNGTFHTEKDFALSSSPSAIVTGDFNHDGILDVATTNTGVTTRPDHSVIVLLGKKGGGFQASKKFNVGTAPVALVATDLNNDGALDLVVADQGFPTNNGNVWVLLGDGQGNFSTPVKFTAGVFPIQIFAADFNNDGNMDIAVTNFGSNANPPGFNSISIMLGDGKGNLAAPTNISFPALSGLGLQVADFDGDGILDLLVSQSGAGTVSFLKGKGTGGFQAAKTVASLIIDGGMAVGDFNHDNIPDFVIVTQTASSIFFQLAVFTGNGDGAFTFAGDFSDPDGPPGTIVAADFNVDGFQDLATVNVSSARATVLPRTGSGQYAPAQLWGSGGIPNGLAVGDFNGDLKPDLAVANFNVATAGGTVSILTNNSH